MHLRSSVFVLAAIAVARPARAECTKEVECKGDRVCDRGQCVAPHAASPAPPPVDVAFRAAGANDAYDVDAPGIGHCTTPCTLRGPSGPWQLHVDGPARFGKTIYVPPTGAAVTLTKQTPGNRGTRTLGWGLFWVSAAVTLTGLTWGSIEGGSGHSEPAVDVVVPIGLFVAGLAGVFGGLALVDSGSRAGFDDAVVADEASPPPARVTRSSGPAVRFVGLAARETARKTIVPALTFEFE